MILETLLSRLMSYLVKTCNGLTTSVERLYQWCAIQTATFLLILAPLRLFSAVFG
jgi:hypothetical protein